MKRVKIKVKYLRDVTKIFPISNGDWIDLAVPFDVVLRKERYEKFHWE